MTIIIITLTQPNDPGPEDGRYWLPTVPEIVDEEFTSTSTDSSYSPVIGRSINLDNINTIFDLSLHNATTKEKVNLLDHIKRHSHSNPLKIQFSFNYCYSDGVQPPNMTSHSFYFQLNRDDDKISITPITSCENIIMATLTRLKRLTFGRQKAERLRQAVNRAHSHVFFSSNILPKYYFRMEDYTKAYRNEASIEQAVGKHRWPTLFSKKTTSESDLGRCFNSSIRSMPIETSQSVL